MVVATDDPGQSCPPTSVDVAARQVAATESPIASERLWLLSSAFSAAVLSSLISIVLFRLDHPKARGVGISFLASSVVVMVGGAIYAYLLLR